MKRRGLVAALGCWPVVRLLAQEEPGQAHRKVSANELRRGLAARFPVDFNVPGLVAARIDVGRLLLMPERQRLVATLLASITDLATRRVVPCDIDVAFALRYEASDQTLRAHHVDVTGLRSPALPPDAAQAWLALLDASVRSAVAEVILHRFTRDELGLADVLGLRPDRITVEDDGVEIWFANKSDH